MSKQWNKIVDIKLHSLIYQYIRKKNIKFDYAFCRKIKHFYIVDCDTNEQKNQVGTKFNSEMTCQLGFSFISFFFKQRTPKTRAALPLIFSEPEPIIIR